MNLDREGFPRYRYHCFSDICTDGVQFCNHLSQRCSECADYPQDCFTNQQKQNCTRYCMESWQNGYMKQYAEDGIDLKFLTHLLLEILILVLLAFMCEKKLLTLFRVIYHKAAKRCASKTSADNLRQDGEGIEDRSEYRSLPQNPPSLSQNGTIQLNTVHGIDIPIDVVNVEQPVNLESNQETEPKVPYTQENTESIAMAERGIEAMHLNDHDLECEALMTPSARMYQNSRVVMATEDGSRTTNVNGVVAVSNKGHQGKFRGKKSGAGPINPKLASENGLNSSANSDHLNIDSLFGSGGSQSATGRNSNVSQFGNALRAGGQNPQYAQLNLPQGEGRYTPEGTSNHQAHVIARPELSTSPDHSHNSR